MTVCHCIAAKARETRGKMVSLFLCACYQAGQPIISELKERGHRVEVAMATSHLKNSEW